MMTRRHARKWKLLAACTTGLCAAVGVGCLQDIFAAIGATFF